MDLRGESLQTRGSEAATKALSLELDGDGLTMEETALMKLEVDLSKVEKRRVIDVARAVKSGDICGLLGLPSTAERKEVKRAYFALSQELHPDQYFGRKIGGFKPLLEQAFTSLAQFVKALNDKRTTLPNSYRTSNNARRMSQRFHLTLRAQVQCDSWNAPEWTETQDISAGGAFLITNLEAVMGEPIRLNVESPNGTIGILGVVVSIRESDQARRERRNSGLGIQFRKAAALDSQRLAELIAEAKRQTPAFTASAPIKSLEAQRLAKRSKARGRKDHIIGIDLGTTNTAVSAVVDNHVQIVPWPDGTYSVPSVVAFPERGRCVVGYEAQKHLLTNPRNVVNSGKRLVGRQFDDPEIASFMAEARFKNFKGPDGTVVAQLQGEDYAIPQICSYLFSAAKHAAAATLGSEPTKAVLTVPVSYDQKQIESVRRSAKLAQLDVIEIIEEPCAAAIANQGQKDFKGIVGVYDFGGGTFDFSLVEAGAGDLRVLATTGDSWLGGDDFDLAIAEAAASMFWKAEGVDLHQKAVEWQYLIYACEKAKRELSSQDYAQVLVPEVARNAQGTVDLRINLARQKVELLWAEPIRRSIDTCKQALSLAGVSMTQLSAIYMSGGTSYIPAIRRNLMKSFGVPVHLGLAPEHAVCAGAGIRAAILQGR
jgi:actin-like ATPase involved in cell morphogenesis